MGFFCLCSPHSLPGFLVQSHQHTPTANVQTFLTVQLELGRDGASALPRWPTPAPRQTHLAPELASDPPPGFTEASTVSSAMLTGPDRDEVELAEGVSQEEFLRAANATVQFKLHWMGRRGFSQASLPILLFLLLSFNHSSSYYPLFDLILIHSIDRKGPRSREIDRAPPGNNLRPRAPAERLCKAAWAAARLPVAGLRLPPSPGLIPFQLFPFITVADGLGLAGRPSWLLRLGRLLLRLLLSARQAQPEPNHRRCLQRCSRIRSTPSWHAV